MLVCMCFFRGTLTKEFFSKVAEPAPWYCLTLTGNPPGEASGFVSATGEAGAQATGEQRAGGHAPGVGRAAGSEVSAIGNTFRAGHHPTLFAHHAPE